ncbi:hypothetical protein [Brevibacillus nitrificans]|uniref:hypothetical protein n=1 Tax=Brevibacillus nitrificans TaxID=651560 RepID=UPI00285D536B|nr:hypothetical protein [Brevibacillus nitrificans]MDR7318911.1 hypothetical protein [Brevibacillus nitrificans]
MSLFKEQLAADTRAVLFNTDEFGEYHTINEIQVIIVLDHDELVKRKANTSNPDDGIHDAEILFYAKREDFTKRPAVDGWMTMDGKQYRVATVQEDSVTYTITLKATRS